MSTPYSGATPAGAPQGYAEPGVADPTPQNYAADYSGGMGTPTTDSGHPDVQGVSVGQLIGEVSKDLSTLMRQELELAKVEMKAEAKKAGTGAGLFGVAGFAGYMVALFLSLALMWALASAIPTGWAGLIVAVLWAIVGAVAGLMGKKKFQQVNPKPERTVDTLQQVPGALKPN
ncbi:putative superfamily III holin-X [Blastococcus colisei]|uniref:Putative superfamily III holin-X n=1 Tax=Blastococcus colisei TaxID=1564162 RepID=A0A543PJK5_9ACTN|nr:phage holin family protein [Blastococcus colisei]TQN44261.1 putative superfamily III holin-X [Blastococcus colisei]